MLTRCGMRILGAVLFFVLSAASVPNAFSFDLQACLKGCSDDYNACMSQTPAKDAEHEQARKQACNERYTACRKNCGEANRGPSSRPDAVLSPDFQEAGGRPNYIASLEVKK